WPRRRARHRGVQPAAERAPRRDRPPLPGGPRREVGEPQVGGLRRGAADLRWRAGLGCEPPRGVHLPVTRDAISAPTEQLVFASGGRWFGVPSGLVQEIAVWNELTRIPGAPQHVLGVFSIRGEMYPVIDPGLLLGS